MKKFVLSLIASLMLCAPVYADYPDEISGEQIFGSSDFVVALVDAQYVPWSIPDPGRYGFEGSFYADGELIVIYLDCAFDLDGGVCIGPAPEEYRGGKLFLWDSDAGAYLDIQGSGGTVKFDVWSGQDADLQWMLGCFDIEPGEPYIDFELSEDCALFWYDGFLTEPILERRGPDSVSDYE